MLNQLDNPFDDDPRRETWPLPRHSEFRLLGLLLALLFPVLAVAGRVGFVQCRLTESFTEPFRRTTVVEETIPSRDGRILAADGRVLAADVERFSVEVHYRWLEEPANDDWLEYQALAGLNRMERRDPERVDEQLSRVAERRAAMWGRLARLTESSLVELDQQRRRVQDRVERIKALVRERRAGRRDVAARARTPADDFAWLAEVWNRLTRELTTAPRRFKQRDEIREELEHHTILEDVPFEAAAEIEAHPELFSGVRVRVARERVYPEASLAAHLIGSRTKLSPTELARRREQFPEGDPLDFERGARIGRSGIERAYDRQLRGVPGLRRTTFNRRREIVASEVVREPRFGDDMQLTIDPALQRAAERILDAALPEPPPAGATRTTENSRGGCIVAIDVQTGAVLAAASAPRFNLNLMIHPDHAAWQRLLDDPRRPFFSRATQMALPPGSVFKTLTAIALLESGYDPDEPYFCHGFLDRPDRHRCYVYRHYGVGHGEMRLSDAICRSCNVYFFAAARRVGADPIADWAARFGFGSPTGIDIPADQAGRLPGRDGGRVDALGLAIGQSSLLVTPLQIARLMAAVANDGWLVTPHLVAATGLVRSGESERPRRLQRRRIAGLQASTLARVRAGLERVVADPRGTGYKTVRLEGISIAGKTGTAEVGGGKPDHAWFAGYAPADRPRVAFAVVMEHAGSGSRGAGPLARQLVRALADLHLF